MNITLEISKSGVFNEVAQTASYTGIKMDDGGAYDRIKTSDEDGAELERFWDESRAEVAKSFVRMLVHEGMDTTTPDTYKLEVDVSSSFDTSLIDSMQLGLFSYFVNSIAGRWYRYCNKSEAQAYEALAAEQLEDVKMKALHKRKPQRPKY